ncbi:hypothetical protein B0O99DRAFT_508356 [Bisporella sp. PMI_857]|nr:hypothetical protein B0O99DRAFT_508356 [Bisporella sp. PMI_857]
MASLKAAKKELRGLMKPILSGIPKESVLNQSAELFSIIKNYKRYQKAKRIGIYLSMPTGEVQTDAIVRDALANGKQVFVPYLHKTENPSPGTPKSVMDMLELHSLSDYVALERDSWGIPTISANTIIQRERILTKGSRALDMILVPGVAFDVDPKTGSIRRLGHGKGYYDYFLFRYKEGLKSHALDTLEAPGNGCILVGLALQEQFLQSETEPDVPVGQYDSFLHSLIVGNGNIIEGRETE